MAFYRVEPRVRADGTTRYKCTVRVKQKGKIVYSDYRTFTKNAAADAWGKQRVAELERSGLPNLSPSSTPLFELINKYLSDPHVQLGRTKKYVLEMLADSDLGRINISDIKPHHIVKHCKQRREAGAGPSTVSHDISYLRWALKMAKPSYGYESSELPVIESYPALHDQNLIGKSERRSRRPTSEEIEKLKVGLKLRMDQRASSGIPYIDLLEFSILSCMRIGEVCRIRWDDVDDEQKAVMVRDRKDPRKKSGNHMIVPLLGGSWEILQRQKKTDEKVFPYNERSVTAGFQRVRNDLGIIDLRYHDLRREGASRLFEKGYTIDEVAQVTGHRNINTLWQVYTELFPKRLHDKEKKQKHLESSNQS
ncbi:site-specific recombinase XerD [Shewanella psychrophila]|uniref:Site-specific recombinase XerD n=1 Tax=Shewanella psychrophila TaxID=225848 RepID=A0A1S6HXA4_9GAMM|nr:site-specific integrase [Shewanella psychrophila]AQS40185.1 site-specific recombinase XerD [Shewanella psychrophila]